MATRLGLPPTRDSTQQLSKVRVCKMRGWKAAAAWPGLARAPQFGGPGLKSQLGMTQGRLQEPWLLCSPHTSTSPTLSVAFPRRY